MLFLCGGLGSFTLATQSALAAYDTTLLSVHMVQHLILAMITPIFLALGAPLTLALRALPLEGRARLLAVIHSRVVRVLTFPAVAGAIFVGEPVPPVLHGLLRGDARATRSCTTSTTCTSC